MHAIDSLFMNALQQSSTEYYSDKTKQTAQYFTDGVKATVGTVIQVCLLCSA